jgi:hypothetical protein
MTLPPPAPGASRTIEIRLALSEVAARTLGEPRMRRLVEIETDSFAVLAPGAVGPLGDHVAYVWVDQPTASKVVVEARVGDRAVDRREIAVRGLAGDVAARLTAIAIAEMVRAEMAPRPTPAPPPPAAPRRTPQEIERAGRAAPALVVTAAGTVAALPGASGVVAGPSLALSFRRFGVSESIFGRWLAGPTQGTALRWLEVGLGAEYRFWVSRLFRIAVGGEGAFASVHLAEATGIEGQPGQRESWSARAGGKVAFELRVARPVWLALDVAPGAILRPVSYAGGTSAHGPIEGAWLGFALGAHFEWVALPE